MLQNHAFQLMDGEDYDADSESGSVNNTSFVIYIIANGECSF